MNWSAIADETAIALIFSFHDYEAEFGRPIFLRDETQLVRRFENWQTASAHILKTVRKLSERQTADFSRHPVPIDAPASSAFATLAYLCRPGSAPNSDRCRAALRDTFANRYCVVRPSADGGRLQLAEFGNGYDHIDEHWNTRTIGTPFGEFEDVDYSRFVKAAYASAWETWKPVLEEINIRKPIGGVPSRYLRILLPTMWGDQPALLSTSLPLNT